MIKYKIMSNGKVYGFTVQPTGIHPEYVAINWKLKMKALNHPQQHLTNLVAVEC